jgi:sugar phosphate isomerase/epimerase
MRKIGVQLYTVRETLKDDFLGTLKHVAAIGYQGVELAGNMGGHTAKGLRRVLDDLGLTVIGGHCGVDAVNRDLDRVLEDYAALGASYLGVAWLGEEWRTPDSIRRAAGLMERAAIEASKHDITFFYHNHAFEFETRINGQYMMDALLSESDPNLLKWELDAYWVRKGGEDPLAYIEKYSGRVPLMHIKDMTGDERQFYEIVGNGIIDYGAVMTAGDAAGVDWYIVEQDQCPKGEVESIRESYQNIIARGWR